MGISFDYYRVFYYVANCGNISLASRVLHYNQPNISRSIKSLEKAVGFPLFVRSNKGVTLTSEGEWLYEQIKEAVLRIETAESELKSERLLESGFVSVGTTEVAVRTFLLPVLNRYRAEYPGICLKITSHTTPEAISSLKSGVEDLAVVTMPTGDIRGLHCVKLKSMKEIAVCGEYYKQLSERDVSLQEMAKYPFISLGRNAKVYEIWQNWFADHGLPFNPMVEATAANQILPFVKNNLGIGIVPEEFLTKNPPTGIYRVRLTDSTPERGVALLTRANGVPSLAAKRLYAMLEAAKDTDETGRD